ncbi:helix-turn-helix domain-containing protein [Falsiruegeria litorea]|uniref:helix-turn-helix domain-containing protein n=1 Tax=Falsiruegeria litorea TaxID=1280831 RepID=UPI001BFD8CF7|nr:helix-turn-helix domain-containing protein [Falsiruegeria litorea]MBT8170435.1 helix-turn-helix domain-containing protein [Falsiruegeria litorea]
MRIFTLSTLSLVCALLFGCPKPTAQVEPYLEALGLDDTLKFIEAYGGTEIYIAQQPQSRSSVVDLVGYAKARALAVIDFRLARRVPLAKKWRAQVYKSQGLKTVEIARKLGSAESTVRLYLKSMPKFDDPNEPPLPLF